MRLIFFGTGKFALPALKRLLNGRHEVLAVVKQLAAEGMTLIMVTHEMRFARDVGDQLVFMHQGLIHESGPAKEVFASPKTAELAAFIGAVQ